MCFHEGRIFLRKGKKDLEAMKMFMNEENEMNVLRFFLKERNEDEMCFHKGRIFSSEKERENKNNEEKKNS